MLKSQKQPSNQSIGKILIQHQLVSRWQIHQVLKSQQFNSGKKIGELLVENGYSEPQHINQILKLQKITTSNPSTQAKSSLGSLLLHHQKLTQAQLKSALKIQEQAEDYLGNILIQQKYISPTELEEGLTQQIVQKHGLKAACKKKLGELLLDFKQISQTQLNLAIKIQKGCQRKLGSLLVDLNFLPEQELQQTLKVQKRLAAMGMTALIGLTLNACSAPIVPYQPIMYPQVSSQLTPAYPGNFSAPQYNSITYPIAKKFQQGNFKTLQLPTSGKTIQVFKNGNKILNDVPFIKQGSDNTCGQAVMAMMLNFWNKPISYQTVVNEGNSLNLPTTNSQITSYTRKKGLKVQDYHDASLNNLYAQINKGRPTIVLLDFGGLSQAHYVVVVGYNQKKGTIIIHDSLGGPYTEMTTTTFNQMWQNRPIVSLPIFGGDSYRRLMFDMTL